MTAAARIAEFDAGAANPSPRDLVAAAAEAGASMLAADVEEGDEDRPDALLGGARISRLEKLREEARRHHVGLFLRLHDTLALGGLRDALGVGAGAKPASLRDRVLVVVANERIGRRLRRECPELPSAFEIGARRGATKGLLRIASPNYRRASADCDDLVVPWGRRDERALAGLAATLARRGARLWISDVTEADADRAAALGAAGVVVRRVLSR